MSRPEAKRGTGRDGDAGLRLRMRGEERRILAQHDRLDALCEEIQERLSEDGPESSREGFQQLRTALDAHMKMEEEIYFPALHGLQTDAESALSELVAEHDELRETAIRVSELLESLDRDGARVEMGRLASRVTAHEQAEEDLIARITEGASPRVGYPDGGTDQEAG